MKRKLKIQQRQRMSRKLVLLYFGSFIVLATVISTFLLNTTNVEIIKAKDVNANSPIQFENLPNTTATYIPGPILRPASDVARSGPRFKKLKTQQGTLSIITQ